MKSDLNLSGRGTALAIALAISFGPLAWGEIKTSSGWVRGVSTAEVQAYLGIPYARPPVGPLRFRPPVPALPWSGVLRANRAGASCLQPKTTDEYTHENCLFLNLWVPNNTAGPLPVLIFIHGGGLMSGSGIRAENHGAALAAQGKVIVATLNYRLGTLGFLSHPALSVESGYGGSGNYGLMDQALAYRWLLDNVTAFGGDPKRVTLMGQSSGANSLCALLTSPYTKPYVQRAILQSQGCRARSLRKNELIGVRLAERSGCQGTSQEVLSCLRSRRPEQLASIPLREMLDPTDFTLTHYAPVVDGYFLHEEPKDSIARGGEANVPLLFGHTHYDGFGLSPLIIRPENIVPAVRTIFSLPASWQVLELYSKARYGFSEFQRNAALLTDLIYRCPPHNVARARHENRHAATFVYSYDYWSRRNGIPLPPVHSSELSLLFQHPEFSESYSRDQRMAQILADYWVQFAKTGDPNLQDRPEWKPFTSDNELVLRLNSAPYLAADRLPESCALLP